MVGAVVLLAALLRLGGLGAESFWGDEVLTAHTARVPVTDAWASVRQRENAPPLYFLIVNAWAKAFGTSGVSLRMPSALFGIATVALLWRLGREWFDRGTGLTAAALLAVSPFHIAYSQEARHYSLVMLLLLLCVCAFVRMLRSGSAASQIALVITAALAMLTHTFALFTLAALNLFYFWRWARRGETGVPPRRWILLQAAILLLFGPWIGATIEVARMGLPWLMHSTPFHQAMMSYAGGVIPALVMAGLSAVAAVIAWRRRDDRILLLALLVLLPVIGPLARNLFVPRYGIAAMIALPLLVAYAASAIGRWACVMVVMLAALTWALTSSPGHARYPHYQQKPDVRSAARYVIAHAQEPAAVVAGTRPFWNVLEHYTLGTSVRVYGYFSALEESEAKAADVWLAAATDAEAGAAVAGRPYDVIARTEFEGVVLLRLSRRAEPATNPVVSSAYPRN